MNQNYYCGTLAGKEVVFDFKHAETCKYFRDWLTPCKAEPEAVRVLPEDTAEWVEKWGRVDNSYTEFGLAVYRTSDYLLCFGKCAFHAAAFLWHEKAFLLTAPSGTGKSTQLQNWMQLYPNETRIMNGDKPILSVEDHGIWVNPSPWKGKERLGDDSLRAPLGGIIFLRQDKENKIRKMKPYEAAAPILERFLCTVENETIIRAMCRMEEAILSSVPVWKFKNTGTIASTKVLHDALTKEISL